MTMKVYTESKKHNGVDGRENGLKLFFERIQEIEERQEATSLGGITMNFSRTTLP
jgi:hypothetical protein